MVVLDEIGQREGRRRRVKVHLPETRPSILDPCLESEPWIDQCCCCSDNLCLFLHNHPIAIILGSPLEFVALSTRLNQLRHRNPRQR